METSGNLQKKRTYKARSLLVPSKASAIYPQCYPAGFEYSPFQINCRKTRLAKTFRRITWQKVHVIHVRISESHPKVAESEPPKVEVQESAFCKVHQTLSTTAPGRGIHSPHTQDVMRWERKQERKGRVFVAMEEKASCFRKLFKISQVMSLDCVQRASVPQSSFRGATSVELRSKSREMTVSVHSCAFSQLEHLECPACIIP